MAKIEAMERGCSKCGRSLQPGEQAYRLLIRVVSDFDGVIPEDCFSDSTSLLEEIRRRTEGVPAGVLEEEIYKEFSFLLCLQCKQKYSANPLNLPLRGIIIPDVIGEPDDE